MKISTFQSTQLAQQQFTIKNVFETSNTNIAENSDNQCRICLESDRQLIQPCLCEGSIGWIHQFCLTKYVVLKLPKQVSFEPRSYIKFRCELCRFQMNFEYDIKSKLRFSPFIQGKRLGVWLSLLIFLVLLSLIEALLLIMMIVYFNENTNSPLFSQGKIWIIITITPVLGVGILFIAFYFICENLYGQIQILGALGKHKKTIFKQIPNKCLPHLGYRIVMSQKFNAKC